MDLCDRFGIENKADPDGYLCPDDFSVLAAGMQKH
jgi:hypothetical protein